MRIEVIKEATFDLIADDDEVMNKFRDFIKSWKEANWKVVMIKEIKDDGKPALEFTME
ncbi:hypothetical protein [Cerasicoccus arenae]|uniref:Uncharacterized protein n=1 Tax=Cerasicoccus arenae TaxID=424488 RepID=A0A8J3D963_9BACT|nr:hypothetical protein [Cerasicoccus arenae]MBK1859099.1 hypothetical protein [Cerasicoccus arenae]GHB91759.1 hypothetical protein GCM10007047_03300 [Cerasicoccus arenae]